MAVTFVRVCCAVAVVNEEKAAIDVNVASVQRPLHTPQYHSMTVPFISNKCISPRGGRALSNFENRRLKKIKTM